ncbi:MAG: siderophore-interacting protein [Myxococcota bacterium]
MSRFPTYSLRVRRITRLSPNMKRLVLGGESLDGFPDDYEGGYIKVLLPRPGVMAVNERQDDPSTTVRRSFSVRGFDRRAQELTLDFAEHAAVGPASRWLEQVGIHDDVRILGPGAVKRLDPTADWALGVADMAALPALAVNLERLPSSTEGHAFIQVASADDQLELKHPPGVELHWIVDPAPRRDWSPLVEAILRHPWRPGRVSIWSATEFHAMKALRAYFRDGRGVPRDTMYISSYWKLGATDEEHKAAKMAETAAPTSKTEPRSNSLGRHAIT